jgi:hypothetical protein
MIQFLYAWAMLSVAAAILYAFARLLGMGLREREIIVCALAAAGIIATILWLSKLWIAAFT